MRRRICQLLAVALILTMGACDAPSSGAFLSIGTGGTGGIYYPFGGTLASRLSNRFPDRQFTAEVTGASVENVRRLDQRQIDIGFATAITIQEAYEGSESFPEPFTELTVVAPLWPNPLNLMTPGDSEIQGVPDLRGTTVSVGAAGSGTEIVSRAILDAFGMTYDDVDERFLSFTESSAGIRDGSLDAAFLEVAFPASAVLEATTTGDAALLPLEGPEIEGLIAERPYFFATDIPAGAYRGVDEDLATIAELNWIVARRDLDPAVVTAVLDILLEDREALIQVNQALSQIELAELRNAPIPLHPAVEAWANEHLP